MSLLYTVTTCRERVSDVDRFVRANLAAGADHAFVFLDQLDPGVLQFLEAHPHVTPIVTDDQYWRGRRPANLNARQTINANLIRVLLAALDPTGWLTHIDADETLHLDLDVLNRLPETVRAVRLRPIEAVSTDQPGWDGWYKPLLRSDQLALLHMLGHLSEPLNAAYFHGHHIGKVAIRPRLDLAIGIHYATDIAGENIELEKHPGLCHLHDPAAGPDQFIAHWTRHATYALDANFKPAARLLRDAVHAVVDSSLPEDEQRTIMLELYRRTAADPVDLLHRLGYLTTPKIQDHQPRSVDETQRRRRERLLAALLRQDPHDFSIRRSLARSASVLSRSADEVAAADPELARSIRELINDSGDLRRPASCGDPGRTRSLRGAAAAVRRRIGRR